ncbi:MAG: response regulator [Jatrophihabitantaceae bacterium]
MARILVVEDNPDNLELMTYLLQASGHTVTVATTGNRGLDLARHCVTDLVVLDVQLPDQSGYDVLAELRSEPALAELPVIAVTANAMVGDRDQALAAGFDGYLPKPIDPRSFARMIDERLPEDLRGHAPRQRWSADG